ncbi:hypothetical protein QWZ04_03805 [Vibrio tapetis subsp. quintayensis]|uniref:hypothetical protein n=1 Tax=Vibrio tapetis TaxID=52443 RepID=UPI0025B5B81C|nr:hypothetical protein [Vibrio tapetis]MDN3679455.1 hypothetical protein [Vibrio tapetis subsp. quintayensis]
MSDVEAIMNYIGEHWRSNHIMSRDVELFLYEFKEQDTINMILAIDEETNEIVGIHGFMKSALNSTLFDVWGSFWHIRDDVRAPMLGAMLIRNLKKFTPYRNRLEIGINKKTTEKIYKSFFKDSVSLMDHFYLLNEEYKDDFKIAKIVDFAHGQYCENSLDVSFGKISNTSDVDFTYINNDIEQVPYKNSEYLIKRYFKHPHYKYCIYKLEGKQSMALLIGREVEVSNRKVFRVIDYVGDRTLLSYSGSFLANLVRDFKYEYIDLYSFGFESNILKSAGFVQRTSDDLNVIPNYFSPYIQENIDIYVSYKNKNALFFKGDGDQDRPNT